MVANIFLFSPMSESQIFVQLPTPSVLSNFHHLVANLVGEISKKNWPETEPFFLAVFFFGVFRVQTPRKETNLFCIGV